MDKTIEQTSAAAMYGGTGTTMVIMGLNLSEFAAIVTAIVAVIGAVVNVWYVLQKNRRAQELHVLSLEELRGRTETDDRETS